jgi:ribosomal protein L11 methyltransferase
MTVVQVARQDVELALDVLTGLGADAVEIRESVADGPVELWTIADIDDHARRALAATCDGALSVRHESVPRRVTETWREHATVVRVGEVTIAPSWVTMDDDGRSARVLIDPEHLFGLGDHPTTRGVLDALLAVDPRPARIVDAGCGSGVLGIAAVVHGRFLGVPPPEVIGFDVAPGTADVVRRNCVMNGIDVIATADGSAGIGDGWAEVTVANILAPALRELASELTRVTAPSGRIILGGMREHQWRAVCDLVPDTEIIDASDVDGWWVATLRRR